MQKIQNYIDGMNVSPISGLYLDNYNPATGQVYSAVADSDLNDVNLAVNAASKAFQSWSIMPALDRAKVLRKIASLIESKKESLAQAESIDTGKPLSVALNVDIPRSALNFEFFADAITQFSSESHLTDQVALNYTLRSPLGVVACISPWNLPLYLLTWKVAPALAAGNCVIAKPSEITPMTASLFADICTEAGLPAGVLNIVHGLGHKVGAGLSSHPGIAAISFTGSTKTGAEIARVAAPLFKKFSLEMGGKNPNIIFADCDFEEALQTTVRSSFSNQGQICLCGSRIFVERAIYGKFKDALIKKTLELRQGNPLDPKTEQGAVVSEQHYEKVLSYIDLAKKEGGKILTGGNPAKIKPGWYIEPTLIEGLSNACQTNQEEIFGPVATLQAFDDEEEVISYANETRYGLAATLWTTNIKRAHRISARLHTGIVWINCWMLRDLRTPFGGMKDSGVGREGGLEALRFFTEAKNVCLKL